MKSIKKSLALLVLLLFVVSLCGCGGSMKTNSVEAPAESASAAYGTGDRYDMDAAEELAESEMDYKDNGSGAEAAIERKLVYTGNVELETKDYETAHKALMDAVKQVNGYVEESSRYGSEENGNRSFSATVRVPAEKYREFLDNAGNIGSVVYVNESMSDITSNYIDVQSRLKSLEAQRDRLNELRQKADKLEDLLSIEAQLTEVQYQLENYTVQMKYMNQQVSYSTVYVNLREVVAYTPANSFVSRLQRALTETFGDFFRTMGDVLIAFVYVFPYLVVLIVIVVLVRKVLRKRKLKKAEKNKNEMKIS